MTQTVERMLPLYEAKMLGPYDHRNADVVKSETAQQRQNQPRYLSTEEHQDPRREAVPINWVREEVLPADTPKWLTGFSDVTSSTNERTVLAAALPRSGVANTYPLFFARRPQLLLAQWNSFIVDYLARQKVPGLHLNFLYLKQLALLPPSVFDIPAPWRPSMTVDSWVTERVVRLSCTSGAMTPMAVEVLGHSVVFTWEESERWILRAELDAAMFTLYGLPSSEVDYVMETFPIVKRKDLAAHGEFRTKRLILEIYEAMQAAFDTGVPYQSRVEEGLGKSHVRS